jgi:hypothetical protein
MTSPTISAPRLSPRATTGLALSTFLLGGLLAATVIIGADIGDDEQSPTADPVTSTVRHQSADAAERWSAPISSPVAQTDAAAALDRYYADTAAKGVSSCRSGSVDAMERCLGD